MSYTRQLIEVTVNNVIPYGDKLIEAGNTALGINYTESKKTKNSKRQQKARITTAHSINRAVKEGRIDPSFKKAADEMKNRARKELAEDHYEKNQYLVNQIGTAAPILDVIVPGSGTLANTVYRVGTIKNLAEHAQEMPNYKDIAVKTAMFVTPIIAGATSALWMPFVAPWLSVAAAGAVSTALVADGIHYLRS